MVRKSDKYEEKTNKQNRFFTEPDLTREWLLYENERRCFHFRYLEHEHSLHCVPSNVSSGLASLPLDFVYFKGTKNTSWPTSKMLPKTSEELSGRKAYSMILPYFTTNDMTPFEVHQLGKEQLKQLYPLVSADSDLQYDRAVFK